MAIQNCHIQQYMAMSHDGHTELPYSAIHGLWTRYWRDNHASRLLPSGPACCISEASNWLSQERGWRYMDLILLGAWWCFPCWIIPASKNREGRGYHTCTLSPGVRNGLAGAVISLQNRLFTHCLLQTGQPNTSLRLASVWLLHQHQHSVKQLEPSSMQKPYFIHIQTGWKVPP